MASTPEAVPEPRFEGYSVDGFLGNGLAGRVHAGRHSDTGFAVAIEVIDPPLGADTRFRERLVIETGRAAILDHPLIVSVHEAVDAGGSVGLVTDPFRGVPVAAVVPPEGLPLASALLMADAVLLALVQAHRAGVVHCAVQPEDVIVDDSGGIRLAGFALGRALHPEIPAQPVTDTHAVAALMDAVVAGDERAPAAQLPKRVQSVLRRGMASRVEARYRTAAGMRTALATAARHEIGPDWREVAASEVATLYSAAAAALEPADSLLDTSPAGALPTPAPAPSGVTPELPALLEPVAVAPAEDEPPPAVVPLAPVIRGVPEAPRSPRTRRVLVSAALIAACVAVGVATGLIVAATRGGGSGASGPLQVGTPVSLTVEPVDGSCNSVFTATARGPVQGHGTLVFRWERSDGVQSADTPLAVSPNDGSFLITEHWELRGTVANPAITFRLLSPVAMTVTRHLGYSCP